MKTEILINAKRIQIALTPESDFERRLLEEHSSNSFKAYIASGSYADCAGGWTREYRSGNTLFVTIKEEY